MDDDQPTRRRALQLAVVAAAATAAGCSSSDPVARPAVRPSPFRTRPPTPRPLVASPAPALAPVARWAPSPRESVPGLKLAAADVVQALCTRRAGQGLADALASVAPLLGPGFDQALALSVLAPLGEGLASTGEIVYPQYGGLDPMATDAVRGAAMVVVRQRVLSEAGLVSTTTRTLDVRLTRFGSQWLVTAVPEAGGEPVARPAGLSPAAVRVLDNPQLVLPDTARWDIHAGLVSDDVLEVLSNAGTLGTVGVTVLRTGHPREVFGTPTVSAHAVGRAVDVWQIAGNAVVDDVGPGTLTTQLQTAAMIDPRVDQVGSPPGTDLDGPGSRRSFANLVHEDHLHLAVRQ